MSTVTRELTVKTNKKSFGQWFKEVGWKHLVTWVLIVYAIFPILYILSTSLTDFGGIENATLFQQFHWQNYRDLLNDPSYPFPHWMMNTIIIAGTTAILSVFISACAAYASRRLRFMGRPPGLLALILIQMFAYEVLRSSSWIVVRIERRSICPLTALICSFVSLVLLARAMSMRRVLC